MIPKYIKLLFCIPVLIIICYFIYLCTVYQSVPDVITIHSYGNNPDLSGSKMFLFLPILLNVVILVFTWRIISRPDKIKFTFEISENEKGKVYHTTQLALVIIAIFVTIMMGPLSFSDVVYK
ncbi:hypothetical protein C1637_00215 [Chryseobacterium lactis]|uniref:DUF1648 domain-containing protein n=1 Tax=Chryseobacterium lactis TaxID=1241981 RepID=A0A3G6RVW9_CHRLC|nr:hypothetical protein [Chryseobacterium lactis]AZA81043.1 hypothetical protein EG342_03600 [Chryseobacterium lactis]AZB06044.1 hypothetical protein EG341_19725 [Chryseobacterium lactis]PNW14894.1 hypothetical protein C1637_00215 [Chryseobacterium lactis]